MDDVSAWRELYRRFEPDAPVPTERLGDWYVERPQGPMRHIARQLEFAAGLQKVLLVGTQGSGKTTELLCFASRQPATRRVVFLDLVQHFTRIGAEDVALQRLQPWELVFLVGLGVLKLGQRVGFSDLTPHEQALRAAVTPFLEDEGEPSAVTLDVGALASSLFAAVGGELAPSAVALASTAGASSGGPLAAAAAAGVARVALAFPQLAASAVSWGLKVGQPGRPAISDQDPRASALLGAVNLLCRHVQVVHSPLLVVLDGLDRIVESADALRVFAESSLLARLEAHLVVTAPIVLVRRAITRRVRGFEVAVMPEIALHPSPGGAEDRSRERGFFRDLYRRRAADLGERMSEVQLDRLSEASGGRVRDFVRFVRQVAAEAWEGSRANDPQLQAVLDQFRVTHLESYLTSGQLDALEAVVRHPTELPDGDATAELLASWRLLPYMNGTAWYRPHPLLMPRLARRRAGG